MCVIAFDTSNYTTSIAYYDGHIGTNESKLLPVKAGELGLRQSDAVFQHIKSLPELSGRLFSDIGTVRPSAIGVSTCPRNVEGSYMPCFTVGYSHAKLMSDTYHVPLYTFSHQEGHIAAAAWSAGRLDLLEQPHLAWHLSGGTTELLYVEPDGDSVRCEKIGGTTDISAGQLIDRTGQLLELPFPSGKHIDVLSQETAVTDSFAVKCNGYSFSLSGVENQVRNYYTKTSNKAATAAFALRSVCNAVMKVTKNAISDYSGLPVIFSGGVASNSMLRRVLAPLQPIFAEPKYSTDNAIGIAILTHRKLR